jgi:hypothetical protein
MIEVWAFWLVLAIAIVLSLGLIGIGVAWLFRRRQAPTQVLAPSPDLVRSISQLDEADTDDLAADLVTSARQAIDLRREVDGLRAEIIRKEAAGEDASTEKNSLNSKENLLRAVERKINWLRRELADRDPSRYGFLRR